MALASFLRRFPDELRADFQQHYGLNLGELGGAYGIGHAACLAAQLPPGSRTLAAWRAAAGQPGRAQGTAMDMAELDEVLARPRREVRGGGQR